MGKFLIGFGVDETIFSMDVTVVFSFLFISKDNEAVAKSISDVSLLSRGLFESWSRELSEAFALVLKCSIFESKM